MLARKLAGIDIIVNKGNVIIYSSINYTTLIARSAVFL